MMYIPTTVSTITGNGVSAVPFPLVLLAVVAVVPLISFLTTVKQRSVE